MDQLAFVLISTGKWANSEGRPTSTKNWRHARYHWRFLLLFNAWFVGSRSKSRGQGKRQPFQHLTVILFHAFWSLQCTGHISMANERGSVRITLDNCLVYVDDISLCLVNLLQTILRSYEMFSPTWRLPDWRSNRRSVTYDVHWLIRVVSAEGIRTNPEKIRSVSDWPTPYTKKELKKFLGLASYWFVCGFSQIASPLHVLTDKSKEWLCTDNCSEAFLELKKCLVTAPVLTLPHFNLELILDTGASGER